jgi:hypothetical protein
MKSEGVKECIFFSAEEHGCMFFSFSPFAPPLEVALFIFNLLQEPTGVGKVAVTVQWAPFFFQFSSVSCSLWIHVHYIIHFA